ncbi:MAG: hypothetical protein ABEJ26_09165 [Halosimplex sp.]
MALDPVTVFVALATVFVLSPALATGYVFARYANLFARLRLLVGPLGIDRRSALGPTLAFLVGFGWLSAAGAFPDDGDSISVPLFVSLLGLAVGLGGVALALGNLGRYRRLAGGDYVAGSATADGVSTGEGDGTVTAPLSGDPSLAWAVRVREHSGFFRRGPAPPVHRESGGTTFVVETATERVRVDPADATLDVWSVAGTGRPDYAARRREGAVPDRVTAYADDRGLGEPDRSRVYEEHRIEDGDRVTVIGGEGGARGSAFGSDAILVENHLDAVREQIRRRVLAGPAGLAVAGSSFVAALWLAGAL